MTSQGSRRAEILDTAARLIATSGVRTSLREIADACGILPGSLYHHFESKDAIVLELIERYQVDLDAVAVRALDAASDATLPVVDRVVRLGTEIAECAVRHRAALLLTFYEPPPGASPEIAALSGASPTVLRNAMLAALRGRDDGRQFRDGLDLSVLADRICQSMLHIGIGAYHQRRGAQRVPEVKCLVLLRGLVSRRRGDGELDGSAAMSAANEVIGSWESEPVPADGDRAGLVRSAARTEFARRGFEATTVRDIAAVVQMSTGSMYSLVESKEELLASIMHDYMWSAADGWDRILRSSSSADQRLDALLWFNANVLQRFSDEYRIQSTFFRVNPPKTANISKTFVTQLQQLRGLLTEGVRDGAFHGEPVPMDLWSRCVISLVWTPENIVHSLGPEGAHRVGRDTVVRGALA